MKTRTIQSQFETREEEKNLFIEGYFALYNSTYQMGEDMSESIAPGAFDNAIDGDIRALINHDTRLVLGRTTSGTLELKADGKGLWGRILVNPNDTDAMNLYARIQRGDVSQCSFGFDILDEDTDVNGGKVHWTIKALKLYEVSPVTFPAYEDTEVSAREKDYDAIKKRQTEAWKETMRKKLGGQTDGN